MAKIIIEIDEVKQAITNYVLDRYGSILGVQDVLEDAKLHPEQYITWTDYRLNIVEGLAFEARETDETGEKSE